MKAQQEEIRAFIAIDLPGEIRDFLGRISSDLKKAGGDVKWVRPESIHLTLKFLGEVPRQLLESIETELQTVFEVQNRFIIRVSGLGSFPGLRNPRVVWAGLEDLSGRLAPMVSLLESRLEPLGFAKEKRSFSPHLTLGRFRSNRGSRDLIEAIRQGMDISGPGFTAYQAVLFQSVLEPSGAKYTALRRFDFLEG